jgi:pimeloyl-ACP methyl ester carboxylesterase
LAEFARALNLGPCPWIGHSLGGKTVLELALSHSGAVTGAAALDMTPRGSEPRYPGFTQAMRALDLTALPNRGEALTRLEAVLDTDKATLQFLLKSLTGDAQHGWRWKLNLAALEREYAEIWKPLAGGRSWNGPAFFLYGGDSDYVRPGDEALARGFFPRAQFQKIEGAGHWLHAEQPAAVLAALNAWLATL